MTCVCAINPMTSKCGRWEENESACICAEIALEGRLPS
jgi:hypothetical protein